MDRHLECTVGDQRYVIGNGFTTMEWLLKELGETNFWNVTWSLGMADAKVRMLGGDAGLVSFRPIGNETPSASGYNVRNAPQLLCVTQLRNGELA